MTGAPDSVSARIAGLCLTGSGRPSVVLAASDAARCAVLVDLALAGRVVQTDTTIDVDPTPTGATAPDRLLAALVAAPERPLGEWYDERRFGLRDVVAGLVRDGSWERVRRPFRADRYRPVDTDGLQQDRELRTSVPPDRQDVVTASVLVLAGVAGLLAGDRGDVLVVEPGPAALAATGPVRWLCAELVEHLVWSRERDRYEARALRIGGVGTHP